MELTGWKARVVLTAAIIVCMNVLLSFTAGILIALFK